MEKKPILKEQPFFDINIDSEVEENTENLPPLHIDANNNVSQNDKQANDRKSIFKFSKTLQKVNSQTFDQLDTGTSPSNFLSTPEPQGKKHNNSILTPTKASTTPPITTNHKSQLNFQTALKKFSPINKTPPPNNLTITQAADLLLNEIGIACYSDDDEDDDDDEDEYIEDSAQIKTDQNKLNLNINHSKKSLNQSDSINSLDNFLNSSTISSLGSNLLENNLIDISVVNHDEEESPNGEIILNESKYTFDSNKTLLKLNDTEDSSDKTPIETDNDENVLNKDNEKCKINGNKTQIYANGTSSNTITKQNLVKSQSMGNGRSNHQKVLKTNSAIMSSILNNPHRNESLVEGLLGDIYDRFNISFKESFDSDVFTEMSSSRFSASDSTADHESESKNYAKNNKILKSNMQHLNLSEIKLLVNEMNLKINQSSAKLIRQLKTKDKLAAKLNRNCDILTALLQARSEKRRVDTQMKFTLNPMPGEAGFIQWKDAMKALTRLPGGVPKEFRKSIWLNLSQKYIRDINLDWNKVRRIAFNDRSNPDDDELGIQIVKDLHRTGCSTFSGQENDQDRALLKRVLLAFARYNKSVGYCQGFNIIAALILEIVDKKEEDAFMCMIYLIDHVLPEGYFTNSMHSLAIDMAVFRELLKTKLPKLYQHLNDLQFNSQASTFPLSKTKVFGSKTTTNTTTPLTTYEPPLTNVFTMQWFLTLFATCLPKTVLLRVWDSIYLEGSEILFRTSLAIWEKLSTPIMKANTADAFYSMMSVLSIKLFDQNSADENNLIEKIYSYGTFPLNGLEELREKFTFNINPFQTSMDNNILSGISSKKRNSILVNESLSQLKLSNKTESTNEAELVSIESKTDVHTKKANSNEDLNLSLRKFASFVDNENGDDEDFAKMISCFALLMPNRQQAVMSNGNNNASSSRSDLMMTVAAAASAASSYGFNQQKNNKNNDISSVTPGAFSFVTQMHNPKPLSEHLTLDLDELKKQYKKLKERQRQAHIIIQTASLHHRQKTSPTSSFSNHAQRLPSYQFDTNASSYSSRKTSTSISLNQHHPISNSPFTLESDPIVNHLLIKSNDPKKNTVKKSIHINSPVLTLNEDVIDYNFSPKTNKSLTLDKIEKKTKKKSKKQQKPYYSDDEDDDSENDDDQSDTNDGGDFTDESTDEEVDSSKRIDAISLLDDSSNLENPNLPNKIITKKSLFNNNSIKLDSDTAFVIQSTTPQPDIFQKLPNRNGDNANNGDKKKSKTSSSSTSSSPSAALIHQLINQEKRNLATPVNPFPVRHVNSNIAKNGVRLGLYK